MAYGIMILAGSNPIIASVNQYAVLVEIFVASMITALISSLLIRRHLFSQAEQLIVHTDS